MQEVWKDIAGHENVYQVSNIGRVRNKKTMHILAQNYCKNKYLSVHLKSKPERTVTTHRLVAFAFVANQNGYAEVNHIDGNKENNCAENLEWCTRKQNMEHAARMGLIKPGNNTKHRRTVEATDILTGEVVRYDSIKEAEKAVGSTKGNVCKACKGITRSCAGKLWRYA